MLIPTATFSSILIFVLILGCLQGYGTRDLISRCRRAEARRRRSFWRESSRAREPA